MYITNPFPRVNSVIEFGLIHTLPLTYFLNENRYIGVIALPTSQGQGMAAWTIASKVALKEERLLGGASLAESFQLLLWGQLGQHSCQGLPLPRRLPASEWTGSRPFLLVSGSLWRALIPAAQRDLLTATLPSEAPPTESPSSSHPVMAIRPALYAKVLPACSCSLSPFLYLSQAFPSINLSHF